METEIHPKWIETKQSRLGMILQTEDWRLEYNATATDMECQTILRACSPDTILQILRHAVSLHIPTWEATLRSADPPDNQLKKFQTGHL